VDRKDPSRIIRYWKSGDYNPRKFYWGWMPPHPTFFVRRWVYDKYGYFNLELGSAADYELMLRFLLKYGITTKYIPEVLIKMRVGGISNATVKNRIAANRMDRKAWEVNDLNPYPWTVLLKPLRKLPQWFMRPRTV
jgi:glycosyltransferase